MPVIAATQQPSTTVEYDSNDELDLRSPSDTIVTVTVERAPTDHLADRHDDSNPS